MSVKNKIEELRRSLPEGVELVAVSKTYPAEAIMEAYRAGQRIFGESRPQELAAKHNELPSDIRWHMIGNLQANKVKYIAPFVDLIHSGYSAKLLETIDKQALKNNRTIDVLLEIRIAREESKSGWSESELTDYLRSGEYKLLSNIRFRGVMGMATFTDDKELIRNEFTTLKKIHENLRRDFFGKDFDTVSMGMSGDYLIAIECGSNMVRVGSYIFGGR